jgi:prepilin-type N-terminal cleavage/methylation domain-containing protein
VRRSARRGLTLLEVTVALAVLAIGVLSLERATGEVGVITRGIEATVRAPAGLPPEVVGWRPLPEPS